MAKIKLTKELPTEEGLYYHTHGKGKNINLYDVFKSTKRNGFFVYSFLADRRVEDYGGYWAKVDQAMFEVEG